MRQPPVSSRRPSTRARARKLDWLAGQHRRWRLEAEAVGFCSTDDGLPSIPLPFVAAASVFCSKSDGGSEQRHRSFLAPATAVGSCGGQPCYGSRMLCCYHWSMTVLPGQDAAAGGATEVGRSCYHRSTTVLPATSGVATIGATRSRRRCYSATTGRRWCYQRSAVTWR